MVWMCFGELGEASTTSCLVGTGFEGEFDGCSRSGELSLCSVNSLWICWAVCVSWRGTLGRRRRRTWGGKKTLEGKVIAEQCWDACQRLKD